MVQPQVATTSKFKHYFEFSYIVPARLCESQLSYSYQLGVKELWQ